MLNKQAILAAQDLPHEDVNVPEWGGVVRVRTMTGVERDAFESESVGKMADGTVQARLDNVRARLCSRCLIDEQGNRLFTDDEVDALSKKSGRALGRVFDVAAKLNGLNKADVEELAGN